MGAAGTTGGAFARLRYMRLALLIAIAAVTGWGQDLPPAWTDPKSSAQISVDLNLVVLPVTVRDRNGSFATDLTKENFQVSEDGAKQSVRLFRHEDIPVTVGVVVDHSGSMTRKIGNVVAAAVNFAKLSNPQDEMFVVNFNERVNLGLPDGVTFTHSSDEMRTAIANAPVAGQTALYDAIDIAIDRVRTGTADKKVLVVISDGGDNASTHKMDDILKKAADSNAIVYTIGIFDPTDPDQNPGVLKKLAKLTGGEAFFPAQYNDAVDICGEIARDIRHQYTLGYISTNTKSGGHRSVRVAAKAPGKDLVVRTRSGYEAAK